MSRNRRLKSGNIVTLDRYGVGVITEVCKGRDEGLVEVKHKPNILASGPLVHDASELTVIDEARARKLLIEDRKLLFDALPSSHIRFGDYESIDEIMCQIRRESIYYDARRMEFLMAFDYRLFD